MLLKRFFEMYRYALIRYYQERRLKYTHRDIFITEFPKSGITWLSFILGNILYETNRVSLKPTMWNIDFFVQDVHQIKSSLHVDSDLRFIKTHHNSSKNAHHIIYLMRQPLDVMVSYYNYRKDEGYSHSFSRFIRDKKLGVDAWVTHVEGWLFSENGARRIHLIRYEDLKENTLSVIGDLVSNLGIEIGDEGLNRSIANSQIDSMKESERFMSVNNPLYDRNFVGKSGKTFLRSMISPDDEYYIRIKTEEILNKYYN